MLDNSKIILRAIELDDSELIRKWRFDSDSYDYFFEFIPVSHVQNEMWLKNVLLRNDEVNFIIEERSTKTSIGMISLLNIDPRNQKCEMGRVLIGAPDFRGRGLGKESITLLIEYAFNHLNMQKIYCKVFNDNEKAVSIYEKCGFKEEGMLRRHIYKNGEFKDVKLMALYK
jgi:RimJ/RimL family protein N-acetyltransferase